MATNEVIESLAFLEKYNKKKIPQRKGESILDAVKRVTHLYLNDRSIKEIGSLCAAQNAKTVYLHKNKIVQIHPMHCLTGLTELYLQWNHIRKIQGINTLRCLQKLYLSNNEIERLENISNLVYLEELYIDRQRIPIDVKFTFERDSMVGISNRLKVLNISYLQLEQCNELQHLIRLEELKATNNRFQDCADLADTISYMPFLRVVEFGPCPAQKFSHYRDYLMQRGPSLVTIDGKNVSKQNKVFAKKFAEVKSERLSKMSSLSVVRKSAQSQMNITDSRLLSVYPDNNLHNQKVSKSLSSLTAGNSPGFQTWNALKPRYSGRRFGLMQRKFSKPLLSNHSEMFY